MVFTAQKKVNFWLKNEKKDKLDHCGDGDDGNVIDRYRAPMSWLVCLHISVHKSNKCITHKDIGKKENNGKLVRTRGL